MRLRVSLIIRPRMVTPVAHSNISKHRITSDRGHVPYTMVYTRARMAARPYRREYRRSRHRRAACCSSPKPCGEPSLTRSGEALVRIPGAKLRIGAGQRRDEDRRPSPAARDGILPPRLPPRLPWAGFVVPEGRPGTRATASRIWSQMAKRQRTQATNTPR